MSCSSSGVSGMYTVSGAQPATIGSGPANTSDICIGAGGADRGGLVRGLAAAGADRQQFAGVESACVPEDWPQPGHVLDVVWAIQPGHEASLFEADAVFA